MLFEDYREFLPPEPVSREEEEELERQLGHRGRLRARAHRSGSWEHFRSDELLEVILSYAVPRQDLSALARRLMKRFGGAVEALQAPREQLLSEPGVDDILADWINQAGRGVRQYNVCRNGCAFSVSIPEEAGELLRRWPKQIFPPECWMMYLDNGGGVISLQPMPEPRRWWDDENYHAMLKDCIALDARNAMLVLFPTREEAFFRRADIGRLQTMGQALAAVQTRLVDCVMVRPGRVCSLRGEGLMEFSRPGWEEEE